MIVIEISQPGIPHTIKRVLMLLGVLEFTANQAVYMGEVASPRISTPGSVSLVASRCADETQAVEVAHPVEHF